MSVRPEQLKGFGELPGSDEEPWDLLLSTTATDEQTALQALAERLGVPFDPEPRPSETAERFYEVIPASAARHHHFSGLWSDGRIMKVATAQPLQPSTFAMLERALGMPVEIVLAPRGAVTNLVNRGYEQRQDLVTEIVEDLPSTRRRSSRPPARSRRRRTCSSSRGRRPSSAS